MLNFEKHTRSSVSSSYSSRTNPFNNEDDDDTTAPSSTSELTSTTSEGSGDVSFAELGLNEDYFSHPEGALGMSTTEELEAAIENCKQEIQELPEKSGRRNKYVAKIVELRLKLQELKEGPIDLEPRSKQILGHKLRRKKSNSVKYYCDCCNSLIWGMLQSWYRCKDCGFNCHFKCVNLIRRKCIAIDISNLPYILNISPENGLSSQQFTCVECKNPISLSATAGKEEARLCDYSGNYYCPQCHWNDVSVIPARVLHNWDFTPQKVSRQSYQILSRLHRRPLLNVEKINSLLFNYVDELGDIRKLRKDILLMKVYFMTCKSAIEQKLLLRLSDRQHFVDDSTNYSMDDLIEAKEGSLSEHLTKLHAEYAKHIKLDCLYCQGKGFICEICKFGETLFPFDFGVSTCGKCKAIFHHDCFTCIDTMCPRCERLQRKKVQRHAIENLSSEGEEDSDTETDYLRGENDAKEAKSTTILPVTDRERVSSKSDAIKINSATRLKKFVHLEPSYSDYAALGFAGAGKSKNSLPEHLKKSDTDNETSEPIKKSPVFQRKDFKIESSDSDSDGVNLPIVVKKDLKIEPSMKEIETKNGLPQQRQLSKLRLNYSTSSPDFINFENNPITRRPQRDESQFGDLVKVKVQSKNDQKGRPKERIAISKSSRNQRKKTSTTNARSKRPPSYDPTLDPFSANTNENSSKKSASLSRKNISKTGNPFGSEESRNPFDVDENYDDSKNPFS